MGIKLVHGSWLVLNERVEIVTYQTQIFEWVIKVG